MSSLLTFNATTYLWSRTTRGIISWPHGRTSAPSGPFVVEALTVPFDPVHSTGGSFWELKEGPNAGWLVSAWTNSLGYGSITVTIPEGDYVPPANPSFPTIDPLADWRILIKGMGGPTGAPAKNTITFNAATQIWSRTTAGIISYDYDLAHNPAPSSGTYAVAPVTVPYDPIHKTGGSFWQLQEGPNKGWLVSDWTNSLGYGDITKDVTADYDRGPGATLATIYRPAAHLAGASLNYNAPGELHFTLLVDDPNVNVPQPKRTHYAVEFYDKVAAAWVEVFAGLIWDMDATDTEVVFYGVDYLGLFQYVLDERFTSAGNIDLPTEKGGSKYVKHTIREIITDQLNYAIGQPDSLVGFIEFGSVANDLGKFRIEAIYSTFRQTLEFVVGLINSYRAGSGKYTRIAVVKEGTKYVVRVLEDPGEARDNLAMRYGELVQGYRVVPFGPTWASRVGLIGQDKTGVAVTYQSVAGAALESEWGRIAQPATVVQTQDKNDLLRRTNQAAVDAAALGRQIGVGLKLGSFRPLEGYDLCDWVPVDINHGAVHTMQWGSDQFGAELEDGSGTPISSGYWTVVGLTWETYDDGHWMTGLSLFPKNAVPYNPGGVEPDYGALSGRGGAGVYAVEITGVYPGPAFETHVLHRDSSAANALPSPSGLDTTRGMIVFVGITRRTGSSTSYGDPIPTGWTRDFDDYVCNGGSLLVMHQVFDPVTNPLPSVLNPTVTFSVAPANSAAIMTGFYTDDPGTPIAIRQHYSAGTTLQGSGVGISWDSAPVGDSVLLAYVTTFGGYFGASGPLRGAHYSPGHLPKENLYDHWGWQDIGVDSWDTLGTGRLVGYTEYGDGTYLNNDGCGFICEYRIPYTDAEDPVRQAHSTGNGPPTTDTTKADDYIDLVSGIQYTYDWATGLWTQVPGTGNGASGLYDFVFTAATSWVVTHTMNGYPRVTVIDSTGAVVNASIHYDSTSQITITFSSAVAGRVHLG